ncbi:MAG: ATP-binding protein [Clostridia bacterium]|nr:ATP-binding protein [Clostridia bacterium]
MASNIISDLNQEAAIRSFLDILNRRPEDTLSVERQIEEIGKHFEADRAYVFELTADGMYVDNTYEWCAEGVHPEKDNLQKVPVEVIVLWNVEFRKHGAFLLEVNEELAKNDPLVYETLAPQNIRRLMAAPFSQGGELVGFFGVDNPRAHHKGLLFLSVVASSLFKEISSMRAAARGIAHLREVEALNAALEESLATIGGLSGEYHTIGIVDKDTRMARMIRVTEGTRSAHVPRDTTSYVPAEELVAAYITDNVDPADRARLQNEFGFSDVLERLAKEGRFSVNYLRHGEGNTVRFHQIVCANADAPGKHRFVFGVRDVDELLKQEQNVKQHLEDARVEAEQAKEDLAAQLALAERQTASLALSNEVISTIAKMYFCIYRIDLARDFYEEVAAENEAHALTGHEGVASTKLVELCDNFVAPGYRSEVLEFLDLATLPARLAETDLIDMNYAAVDGNWHAAGFIAKKRDANGVPTHVLYVTRLVSPQKVQQIEQSMLLKEEKLAAERASDAKSAFLFNMSHDIRTPMNAIIGYTELMEKYSDDRERCLGYLKKVRSAGDFLLSLINNVLEMARIESGKAVVDEAPFETRGLIGEVADVYTELMRRKGVSFTLETDIQTPYILCDKVKLDQISLNLVSNAFKYTPEGGSVTMRVRELPGDDADSIWLETVVSDTGIGMSKEYLPTLFDEFTREFTSTENKVQGTGLGMPIVKKLITLMGGTIDIESELGKGTTFRVLLPHRKAKGIEAHGHDMVHLDDAVFAGKRILLAEDNELNTEIVTEILSEAGFAIEHAADGIICVDMFTKSAPGYYDLILMDIQMPNMNGYKATEKIRRLPGDYAKNIPIVAMTANAFEEDRRNALNAGMNAHLAKPIDIALVMDTLAEMLGHRA